ncbi:MAG: membrane protein insertion efficiency factor YidD [Propionibacteriaceae bacterium]|jgi:putative membrane protein insertion efficiency factor|nr:membrane protein insertion efficiency factor YidD [Propionibacteriaceae bacterium]
MRFGLIALIKFWRAVISPSYGNVCKFFPSCSEYGLKAVERHGALKGSWLIVRRLVRCHPWSLGGYDPVPAVWSFKRTTTADPADVTPAESAGEAVWRQTVGCQSVGREAAGKA